MRARDSSDACRAATAQLAAAAHRAPQRRDLGAGAGAAPPAHRRRCGRCAATASPASRCSCRATAASTCARTVADGRAGCRVGIGSEHPEPEVEPIEQRRRQPPQVPRALHVGAAAVGLDPTTRARVAARDQQEVGRELGGARRPADPHDAFFERLAQRVEHDGRELGQLVEEERAVMRERDLARAGARAPPADERDRRCAVVRRAERAGADETGGGRGAGGRVDLGDFQRRVERERREDRREAAREHRLADARRPDVEEMVRSRGRDGEGVAGGRRARAPRRGRAAPRPRIRCRRARARGRRATAASPFRHWCTSPSERATRTSTPGTSAASRAFASGTMTRPTPARASASTSARVPCTGRTRPSSPSSPRTPRSSRTPAASRSSAPASAIATASSRPAPVLRTSAGARLTVTRRMGQSRSDESNAARDTLARLAPGRVGEPDDRVARQAARHVHLDRDDLSVDPTQRGAADEREHNASSRRR